MSAFGGKADIDPSKQPTPKHTADRTNKQKGRLAAALPNSFAALVPANCQTLHRYRHLTQTKGSQQIRADISRYVADTFANLQRNF